MRKEVKLGMAIGGGLLAVLVVYLLVTPPNKNAKGTQLAGGNGSIIDVAQGGEPNPTAGEGQSNVNNIKPVVDVASGSTGNDSHASADPSGSPDHATSKADASGDGATEHTGSASDDWRKLLQTGKTSTKSSAEKSTPAVKEHTAKEHEPILSGKTGTKHEPAVAASKRETVAQGTVSEGAEQGHLYYDPHAAWGDGVSTSNVFGTPEHGARAASGHSAASTGGSARPAPAVAGATTHVVQSGDTLSSIAEAVYGSANYYPHILRANPQVNPNNLKLGTVLTLPRADEVKATATPGEHANGVVASIAPEIKIDSTRQYQVQSGDSLYKISLKLYGKSTYVEKIYEKNKAVIGSDPKKLKLGMILELPEKTTVAAASPASSGDSDEQDRK